MLPQSLTFCNLIEGFYFTGVQKHVHVCVDEDTNNHLEEHNCETPPPPILLHTTCLPSPCPPRLASHSTLFPPYGLAYAYSSAHMGT